MRDPIETHGNKFQNFRAVFAQVRQRAATLGGNFAPSVHVSESAAEDALVTGDVLSGWLLRCLNFLRGTILAQQVLPPPARSASFLTSTPAVRSGVLVSPTFAQTACAATGPGVASDVLALDLAPAAVLLARAVGPVARQSAPSKLRD